jgi:hypothetical protein
MLTAAKVVPPQNMPTIQCLIGFLRLVCQRADKNMMSSQNIALGTTAF